MFGEYAPSPKTSSDSVRRRMLAQYGERPNDFAFHRELLKGFNTHSDIPSLDRELVREYPGWTQEVPDVVKAGDILAHLADWETAREMPNLVMIILPNDHTQGTSAGWCTPRACVADNDLALGKIVEGLSHSTFWKDMAILVVEDDAQNGVDHIDGHRTVALAISPYARRGVVDSTFYGQAEHGEDDRADARACRRCPSSISSPPTCARAFSIPRRRRISRRIRRFSRCSRCST